MRLLDFQIHFSKMYGRNNAVFIPSLLRRITLLQVATRTLQDCLRKKESKARVSRALAHVFAWAYAVVDNFKDLPLEEAMCTKYPLSNCGYCGKAPCECLSSKREVHHEQKVDTRQLCWPLSFWQQHLGNLYGNGNKERGIDNALLRLGQEIAEVSQITEEPYIGCTAEVIQKDYAMEIADVFAWIIGIAVILDIDLQLEVRNMFEEGCPCCGTNPCSGAKYQIEDGRVVSVMSSHFGTKTV